MIRNSATTNALVFSPPLSFRSIYKHVLWILLVGVLSNIAYSPLVKAESVEESYEECVERQQQGKFQRRRRAGSRNTERLIDIDIIFYNDSIIETAELCVPHKHMHERMFVLTPLHNIAPEMTHPKYNKTVDELLQICTDKELVIEYAL